MQDFCRKTLKLTQCEPEVQGNGCVTPCKPFQVCLPFGRSLKFDGKCMTVEGEVSIPDGEYGVIIVENGCIVDARPNPVFEYTPPPCTPAAESCSSSSSDITLQTDTCNLLRQDSAGRLGAYLVVEAGDNITLRGCGSSSSPLVISATVDVDTSAYLSSASTSQIVIDGTGTASDPYVIGLAEVFDGQTINGMRFDRYGRLVQYTEPTSSNIVGVVGGAGITVVSEAGVAVVTLSESGVESGDYQLGGYAVTLDLAGRVTEATRNITVTAGSYDMHAWLVTVNSYGSITGFTAYDRPATNHAVDHFTAGSTISITITTDSYGYLYAVWTGYMSMSSATTGSGYVSVATSQMSGSIEGTTTARFSSGIGKVSSSTSGTTTTYVLTEWRAKSASPVGPGEYTVTISTGGTVSGTSVLDVSVVCTD